MKKLLIYALIAAGLSSCKEKEKPVTTGRVEAATGRFAYISSSWSGITFKNTLSGSEYDNIIVNPNFYDGAGVAVGDINKDGLQDIYFVSNQWENKLYLNKGDLKFEDITVTAGVSGANVWDSSVSMIDKDGDGWLDIDVGQKLYINRGDLTFTTITVPKTLPPPDDYLAIDINNDSLVDRFTSGRFPYDEKILKTTTPQSPNKLQVNIGNDNYIDIAWYAGVAATDWSSRAAIADFDGDGLLDIFVPNGVVGRVNDRDFLNFPDTLMTTEERASRLPSGAIPNFFFKQTADLKFEDVTKKWIGTQPSVSTGVAYADLDNDGDLDIVVNNTNSEAFILRNDLPRAPKVNTQKAGPAGIVQLAGSTKTIPSKHTENSFNTFDMQPLIPFSNATRGPRMSAGDVNGDRLQDVYIGGGPGQAGAIYVQTRAGKFVQTPQPAFEADKQSEETCSALFDIDNDRDLDLMVGSGGEEFLDKRISLRLYLNNGRGTFMKAEGLKRADLVSNMQKIYVNASCIIPADIDNDKDMDVFVGGGTVTGRYGVDSDSFILLNNGKGLFTESPASFENRQRPGGMVQAAAWTNINGDEFPDLVTAGEWMTVSIWLNANGVLTRQADNGLDSAWGWWNSLAVDDLDNDGDVDIVAGNIGLNGRLHASDNEPLKLMISDVDKNGRQEPLISYYNGGQPHPLPGRDEFLSQVPSMERTFPRYSDYANARVDQLLMSRVAIERHINTLASTYFENQGNGKFVGKPLPAPAQYFPVLAIEVADVNEDEKKDIMLAGNLGANSEGFGLILINNGSGNFSEVMPRKSGFILKGESRDIQSLTNFKKEKLYLVTRNNDSLVVFKKREIK